MSNSRHGLESLAIRYVILRLLQDHDDYGYHIIARVRHIGLEEIPTRKIYTTLVALEKEGLLDGQLQDSAAGPPRRVLTITKAGSDIVDREGAEIMYSIDTVKKILEGLDS